MLKYFVVVCILFIAFGVPTEGNVKTCYHCDSYSDPACGDPFDASKIEPTECSSILYGKNNLPENTSKLSSILTNVEQVERNAKSDYSYGCIKLDMKLDAGSLGEIESITRTCVQKTPGIDDVCKLLESQSNDMLTIYSCYYCERDNCNSGVLYKASGVFMGVILLFVYFF